MIPVADARARIVKSLAMTGEETVVIADADRRVLAMDAVARMDQPPAPVSAMDGYAVRLGDAAPLRVVGAAPAGHPFAHSLQAGEAVRIFTGGVMPQGADAIIIQENAQVDGETVLFAADAATGRHIRHAGIDFRAGAVLANKGRMLGPRDLALLAAGDIAKVTVRARPRVAFAATGDELTRPGEARGPGRIVASNGYGLAALIARWGGEPVDLGILPDRMEAIAAIADADADLIITLGGASVGDHDLVQKALGTRGFVLDFWKIAMRPGKPVIFGRLGNTPLLGLPGNPVSSFVCAQLFVKAAIRAMLGGETEPKLQWARLDGALPANDAREDYLRARLSARDGETWIETFAAQDSSLQSVLAAADALLVRSPLAPAAGTGDRVPFLLLDD